MARVAAPVPHKRVLKLIPGISPPPPSPPAAGSPTGLWRMSGHPAVQQALRNAYFEWLVFPKSVARQADRWNRGVRTRMPGGVEGWRREHILIPINPHSSHALKDRV